MKRAHMVGNGPSYKDFSKIDETDFVVGCNLPHVPSDLTFICDIRFLNTIVDKNLVIPCPAMVSYKIQNYVDRNKHKYNGKLNLKGVMKKRQPIAPSSLSSGHHAALWLIDNGYEEIHIWGCDGLVTKSMDSKTDEYVTVSVKSNRKHCERHTEKWKKSWQHIVKTNGKINFIFHNFSGGKIT